MALTILIVDDNPAWQLLLHELLRSVDLNDVKIVGANTAESGVKMYEEMSAQGSKPDLVLMDQRLPVRLGCDAVTAILKTHSDANIYGFSFYTDEGVDKLMKKAGVVSVISKRLSGADIATSIKEALVHGE